MKEFDWTGLAKQTICGAGLLFGLELLLAAAFGLAAEKGLLPIRACCLISEILFIACAAAVSYWCAKNVNKSRLPAAIAPVALTVLLNAAVNALLMATETATMDWRLLATVLISACAGVWASRKKKTYARRCAR